MVSHFSTNCAFTTRYIHIYKNRRHMRVTYNIIVLLRSANGAVRVWLIDHTLCVLSTRFGKVNPQELRHFRIQSFHVMIRVFRMSSLALRYSIKATSPAAVTFCSRGTLSSSPGSVVRSAVPTGDMSFSICVVSGTKTITRYTFKDGTHREPWLTLDKPKHRCSFAV